MKNKTKLFAVLSSGLVLTILCSLLDVMFFRNNLYQGITGSFMLFFIRSGAELGLMGLGILAGYLIWGVIKK